MENAVDAIKIGFALLVFVIAITLTFSLVGQARATSDAVFASTDKTEFYDYSLKADYVLNISHGYAPKYYTIYEYDAKNQLINETSFSTLEEFYEKFHIKL